MAKKNFTGGIGSLLGETKTTGPKREPSSGSAPTPQTSTPAVDTETRATFIVNESDLDKLKAIAYWDRVLIKEVLGQAIKEYLERYEKANGVVKSAPKK